MMVNDREYTDDMVTRAAEISKKAHAGQVDKAGVPYWTHPARVAKTVRNNDEKIVAYLHDVLEDTDYPEWKIREEFGDRIADAVLALTRRNNETYMEYVIRASENNLARTVKMADLTDNMNPNRIKLKTEKDYTRIEKYKAAYAYMELQV